MFRSLPLALCLYSAALGSQARGEPTVADALQLKPIQADVKYDQPTAAESKKCTLKIETAGSVTGWVVRGPNNRVLRRFLDTNGDNKLDQWCYFSNNIEIYRDIDGDFDSKADQYRWMGNAGARWAIDDNEDGVIDRWRYISAEEVSLVVVNALRTADSALFKSVLLTEDELKSLGLGATHTERISFRISKAAKGFGALARKQTVLTAKSKWLHFGGSRPGLVPAGFEGAKKDVFIYDNVAAIADLPGKHHQVNLGTLVRVGESWKLIDLPSNLGETQVAAAEGFFFREVYQGHGQAGQDAGASEEMQSLIAELEQIDKDLAATSSSTKQSQLQSKRADVMEKLANLSGNDEDRSTWIRQFADSVSAAAQSGGYPDGVARLKKLNEKLIANGLDDKLIAYVKFRFLSADYSQRIQDPKADFAKIQEQWLTNLEKFVRDYPQCDDAAEAMLQLGIAKEFAGEEKEANRWYSRVAREFPTASLAAKATGAKRRLESVGKSITLKGQTIDGKALDLSAYGGRVVVVHYWATYCEPCKDELLVLKNLQAKYGRRGLSLIGVNLDNEKPTLTRYLTSNRLPWPQLHGEGGLDSRLANEMGVLTLPTMLLIDKQGKVISRNIRARELDAELKKLIR